MGVFIFALFILLIVVWSTLRNRIAELESRLRQAERRESPNVQLGIADLTKRVFRLELELGRAGTVKAAKGMEAEQHADEATAPKPAVLEPVLEQQTKVPASATVLAIPRTRQSHSAPATSPSLQSSQPAPTWIGRFRKFCRKRGSDLGVEWIFALNTLAFLGLSYST